MLCATAQMYLMLIYSSNGCQRYLTLIYSSNECLLRGRYCSTCWVHSSEQTGQAPPVSRDSHTDVVFASMHASRTPAHLPVVRGQQAGFPIILVAAWSSVWSLSSPWLQGVGQGRISAEID